MMFKKCYLCLLFSVSLVVTVVTVVLVRCVLDSVALLQMPH
jgi:hypothetical protein